MGILSLGREELSPLAVTTKINYTYIQLNEQQQLRNDHNDIEEEAWSFERSMETS